MEVPGFARYVRDLATRLPPLAVPQAALDAPEQFARALSERAPRSDEFTYAEHQMWAYVRAQLGLPDLEEVAAEFLARLEDPLFRFADAALGSLVFASSLAAQEAAVAVLQRPELPLRVNNAPEAIGADVLRAAPRVRRAASSRRRYVDAQGHRYVVLDVRRPQHVLLSRKQRVDLPPPGSLLVMRHPPTGTAALSAPGPRRAVLQNYSAAPKSYGRPQLRSQPRSIVAQLRWLDSQ